MEKAKHKKQKLKYRPQRQNIQLPENSRAQSRFGRLIKAAIAVLYGCAAFATIYAVWGPFWPTAPIVGVDGLDAVVMPLHAAFSVRNRSFVFPIRVTSLGCQIRRIDPLTAGDVDVMVGTNATSYIIPPSTTRPMRCKVESGQRNDITRIELKILLRYEFPWLSWLHDFGGLNMTPIHWTPNHWSKDNMMQ